MGRGIVGVPLSAAFNPIPRILSGFMAPIQRETERNCDRKFKLVLSRKPPPTSHALGTHQIDCVWSGWLLSQWAHLCCLATWKCPVHSGGKREFPKEARSRRDCVMAGGRLF